MGIETREDLMQTTNKSQRFAKRGLNSLRIPCGLGVSTVVLVRS